MERDFISMLRARQGKGLRVCIGFDPDVLWMPLAAQLSGDIQGAVTAFLLKIAEATHDVVCAIKLNSAFFEQYGLNGLVSLYRLMATLNKEFPDLLTILDGKRADVGHSSLAYAEAIFNRLGARATTVNPYLGFDSVEPFLEKKDCGVFVLCKTSNPGSFEFQNLPVQVTHNRDPELFDKLMRDQEHNTVPMYLYVAYRTLKHWNKHGNCGLVVGANHIDELARVRDVVGPDMPLLLPGLGAQSNSEEETVKRTAEAGGKNIIVNLSRSALYASDPRQVVLRMNDLINKYC